jgi:hypothetical protein
MQRWESGKGDWDTNGDLYALRLKDGFIQRLTHNKWEDGLGTWASKPGGNESISR